MSTPPDDAWEPTVEDWPGYEEDGYAGADLPDLEPEPHQASGADEPASERVEFDPLMLAEEIAELSHQVAKVGPLSARVQELAASMEQYDENWEQLLAMLEATAGGPWLWHQLEPTARRKLWLQLGEWVAWLRTRWLANLAGERFDLPGCWYLHPPAVELLTALMVAHNATYSTKARVASPALVDWHTRYFVPVFELLHEWGVFTTCRREHEHREPTPRPAPDETGFAAFVDADTTAEDEPAPDTRLDQVGAA